MDQHAIRSRDRLAGPKTDLIPLLEDALYRALVGRENLPRTVTDNIAGGIARVLATNNRASEFISGDLVVLAEEFAQEFREDVIEGAQAVWDDYVEDRARQVVRTAQEPVMAATGGE